MIAKKGFFTKTVLRYYPELLKRLRAVRDDILIINFERRNLAANQELFQDIVLPFLTFDRNSKCDESDCPWRGNCVTIFQKKGFAFHDSGNSLNLTKINHVIYFDRWWNLAMAN